MQSRYCVEVGAILSARCTAMYTLDSTRRSQVEPSEHGSGVVRVEGLPVAGVFCSGMAVSRAAPFAFVVIGRRRMGRSEGPYRGLRTAHEGSSASEVIYLETENTASHRSAEPHLARSLGWLEVPTDAQTCACEGGCEPLPSRVLQVPGFPVVGLAAKLAVRCGTDAPQPVSSHSHHNQMLHSRERN
jgi:hypothetical protein